MTGRDDVDLGGMTCRDFVELVTDYLEDRLDAEARARFEQHLAECPGCARYLDQIRASAGALGRLTLDTLSPDARAHLLDAFRTWRSARPGSPG